MSSLGFHITFFNTLTTAQISATKYSSHLRRAAYKYPCYICELLKVSENLP